MACNRAKALIYWWWLYFFQGTYWALRRWSQLWWSMKLWLRQRLWGGHTLLKARVFTVSSPSMTESTTTKSWRGSLKSKVCLLKGIFHARITILSSFSHSHVKHFSFHWLFIRIPKLGERFPANSYHMKTNRRSAWTLSWIFKKKTLTLQ